MNAYTILRPGWIPTNYLLPAVVFWFPDLVKKGELVHSYEPGARMPHIDEDDVGKFAAAALLDPEKYGGEEIELGYDNLTIGEIANIMRNVTGIDIPVRKRMAEETGEAMSSAPGTHICCWANRVDLTIDGPALEEKYGIKMTSMEEYMQRQKDRLLATIGTQ
jgi:nucleoside-diphosphate-sugar epimerase